MCVERKRGVKKVNFLVGLFLLVLIAVFMVCMLTCTDAKRDAEDRKTDLLIGVISVAMIIIVILVKMKVII